MPTSEEIARELEIFYRHYIDVFNREDDRFFDCFAQPYAAVSGERGLTTVANETDNRKSFGGTMTALKKRGWARSGIDRIKAWALAENLGLILSDVTRYQADNSVLEKIRACYMLRRDGASWKIMTISEVKPPYLGPGDIPRQP
jgi:hypothetical protein